MLGRCADRLGVRRIVLLALDKRLHIGWRDQTDLMPKPADLTAPIVAARAGFHRDNATLQTGKELQNLAAPKTLANNHSPFPINAMHLENVFARSRPIVLTSPTDASFDGVQDNPSWHTKAVRGRPTHQSRENRLASRLEFASCEGV